MMDLEKIILGAVMIRPEYAPDVLGDLTVESFCPDLQPVWAAVSGLWAATGKLDAAVQACAVVDECVGRMADAVRARGGRLLLIADHGNCEVMISPDGSPQTAHTTNPVPCILLDAAGGAPVRLADGKLADVAPTLLRLWGMDIPAEMSGTPLVQSVEEARP